MMPKLLNNGSQSPSFPKKLEALTCGDLFAGAGGLSLGFHSAEFQPLFFNEIDEQAAKTFRLNLPGAKPFIMPIQDLQAERIFEECGLKEGDLDIMIGGPPCQGFSINAPIRSGSDPRNHLFRHYIRLVLEGIRPKFIVMENVPGLISHEKGQTFSDVLRSFEQSGYSVAFRILNAAHYGVPQERWRLFILGTRLPRVALSFPYPSYYSLQRPNFTGGSRYTFAEAIGKPLASRLFGDPLQPPVTVGEAISDLPPLESGKGNLEADYLCPPQTPFQEEMRKKAAKLYNHICANTASINQIRLRHVKPGGSWRDIPRELLPEGMKRARTSDHTKRYGRLDPQSLSGTIMTKCDPHWGTVIHYSQDRIISVREAARFQSFPDWFRFTGSKIDQYRQVGNAVPPALAQALAKHISALYVESQNSNQVLIHRG